MLLDISIIYIFIISVCYFIFLIDSEESLPSDDPESLLFFFSLVQLHIKEKAYCPEAPAYADGSEGRQAAVWTFQLLTASGAVWIGPNRLYHSFDPSLTPNS